MIQLVDDQLVGRVLKGDTPLQAGAEVFTTGYWYVRLCQAVLRASERIGVLPPPFAALLEPERSRALNGLLELPELSLRAVAST